MPKSRGRKRKKAAAGQGRFVKLTPRMKQILEEQRERFIAKFGREPGPNDTVFFDPDAADPQPMPDITDHVLEAMNKANLPPEFAYAYRKTGLLGLGADKSAWDPADIEEWNGAVDEYRAMEEAQRRPNFPREWHTEIPAMLLSGFSQADYEKVRECMRAIASIEERGMTVAAQIELAAAFASSALAHAYQAAEEMGDPGDAATFFAEVEDMIIQRAREIYSQGHG